jgi:hypothetical protein
MQHTIIHPPTPGAWVDQAQHAIDALSQMRTGAHVLDTFASTRRLAEIVLGFPVAGGHATRRAIRGLGLSLRNRLGPALAAEVLSWAASVANVVDTTAIELLLESAAGSMLTCRPRSLADRWELQDHLTAFDHMPARRRELLRLWDGRVEELDVDPPGDDEFRTDLLTWFEDLDDDWDLYWDAEVVVPVDRVDAAQIIHATTRDDQLELFARAPGLGHELARSSSLFELAEPIVEHCLLHHTAAVLTNPACSTELRDRIRLPYDQATLELAVRAGVNQVDRARLRRMLAAQTDTQRARLLDLIPIEYLTARRWCGLLTCHDLVDGDLAAVDLCDRSVAGAALGCARQWSFGAMPAVVLEVLTNHPQADDLAWLIRDLHGMSGEVARRLIDAGPPQVRCAAVRRTPGDHLEERDGQLLLDLPGVDALIAACPGIPGARRPATTLPTLGVERYRHALDTIPFTYPPQIMAMLGPDHPGLPGWTFCLPESPVELQRNAQLMRNCTMEMLEDIADGRRFLLIVHGPRGDRYNVEIHRRRHGYEVGQINSHANGGIEPTWLRPALGARLSMPEVRPTPRDRSTTARAGRDRRDRRARRAAARARRRR